jgi:hypothetical protein
VAGNGGVTSIASVASTRRFRYVDVSTPVDSALRRRSAVARQPTPQPVQTDAPLQAVGLQRYEYQLGTNEVRPGGRKTSALKLPRASHVA